MKNSMDNIINRKGRLEYEQGLYYIYDGDKGGNQFNCAFQESEISRIVSLNEA
jgi:hypothetical protein